MQHFEPLIENAWYVAAWSSELRDKPLARQILNQNVVLFRDSFGRVGVLEDRCCHRAAPLAQGEVVAGGLQCGYHGMTFDVDGQCVANPGEPNISSKMKVQSFPIIERQNFVWVWMGEPSLAEENDIVDFPFHKQGEEWPFQFERYHIGCNYMLIIDNLMDLSHLAYVHRRTIGDSASNHAKVEMNVEPTENGVKFLRWILDTPPPPTFVKAMGFKTNVDRWSDFEYLAPSSVLQWAGGLEVGRNAQKNRHQKGAYSMRMFHAATPETEHSCHYFWSVANGYRQDDPHAATELYNEIAPTFDEDVKMLEAQQRILERDPSQALILRQQDEALSFARKAIRNLANRTVLNTLN
jgi:phenylpropionate dioxygenase-like ring-hydroxylating dioxygenase large terminal subunit